MCRSAVLSFRSFEMMKKSTGRYRLLVQWCPLLVINCKCMGLRYLVGSLVMCCALFFLTSILSVDMTFEKKLLYCTKTPTQQPITCRIYIPQNKCSSLWKCLIVFCFTHKFLFTEVQVFYPHYPSFTELMQKKKRSFTLQLMIALMDFTLWVRYKTTKR